ncbi:proline-rich protein 36-like [Homarus americanus]|uniref:proline-rich protein 36-like n=1 Tax=Homarus americanus TaxID=6706 RepID=UPI001C465FD7|nr:proline-rich protein 36-like [Homarus americanus]
MWRPPKGQTPIGALDSRSSHGPSAGILPTVLKNLLHSVLPSPTYFASVATQILTPNSYLLQTSTSTPNASTVIPAGSCGAPLRPPLGRLSPPTPGASGSPSCGASGSPPLVAPQAPLVAPQAPLLWRLRLPLLWRLRLSCGASGSLVAPLRAPQGALCGLCGASGSPQGAPQAPPPGALTPPLVAPQAPPVAPHPLLWRLTPLWRHLLEAIPLLWRLTPLVGSQALLWRLRLPSVAPRLLLWRLSPHLWRPQAPLVAPSGSPLVAPRLLVAPQAPPLVAPQAPPLVAPQASCGASGLPPVAPQAPPLWRLRLPQGASGSLVAPQAPCGASPLAWRQASQAPLPSCGAPTPLMAPHPLLWRPGPL